MSSKRQVENSGEPKKRKQQRPGGSLVKKVRHSPIDAVQTRGGNRKGSQQTVNLEPKPRKNVRSSGDAPKTARERRIHAKELTEARKKKRKRHYSLERELAALWETMRQGKIANEERSRLITLALQKMKGKIPEIASSHVTSRVLQTCVKHCFPSEREAVFAELKPHFLTFACNTYAVHLVKKMLDTAGKKQLTEFIGVLRGHVASLLRNMVGSVVVEHVYQLGNASQKQEILLELYSTEFQLFKHLTAIKESRLLDIIQKLGLSKSSVLYHMNSVVQPILEKGIVDHSIIHRVILEYFTIADKSSAIEVIKQLSSPLLVRMIHTRDGSRLGIICVKYGSAKERKKVVKGMKDHVVKIARDHYGSLVLSCILSTVDDTKLLSKIVNRELQPNLKDLAMDKNGRRPLLQLLHPNTSHCFSPDDLDSLALSIPSLNQQGETDAVECHEKGPDASKESDVEIDGSKNLAEGGKKDPFVRRQELLVKSGLAEKLVEMCAENAGELLRSSFGKEVISQVACGGSNGILLQTLADKVTNLHDIIASLASASEDSEDHILRNFHSSRIIRNLVINSPDFAKSLWTNALKGKCSLWAHGHSCKVISAFLRSNDSQVREVAAIELKPLVDSGIFKSS